jgi:hypothetical protein
LEGFLLKLQTCQMINTSHFIAKLCNIHQHFTCCCVTVWSITCVGSLRIWRTYHQDEQYMVKCEKIRAFDPCPVFDVSSKHIKSIQIPVAGFESGPPF